MLEHGLSWSVVLARRVSTWSDVVLASVAAGDRQTHGSVGRVGRAGLGQDGGVGVLRREVVGVVVRALARRPLARLRALLALLARCARQHTPY